MGAKRWTNEEIAALHVIHASDKTAKELMHLIPGRSLDAIRNHMADIGMAPRGSAARSKFSWVEEAMTQAFTKAGRLTVDDLIRATGASAPRVRSILYEGRGTRFHVSAYCRQHYSRGSWTPQWVLGAGEDAAKPAPISKAESERRNRLKRRAELAFNPFLTVLGGSAAPQGARGCVFKQDMTIHLHDELEDA